jgi:hypothetical protein
MPIYKRQAISPIAVSHRSSQLFKTLLWAILLASQTTVSAYCQASADLSQKENMPDAPVPPSGKQYLQGNIEHAEVLPRLDERLRPGAGYDESLLLQLGTQGNNDWFWIPSWYAGKRHTEEALIVYRHDFATGITTNPMQRQLERQEYVSGYQKDRNGGIWELNNAPFIQHIDSGFMFAVLYIREMTPVEVSEDRIVLRYREISVAYSKKNNKILESTQQEQLNTLTPMQPGTIHADVSVKSFGWDGQPQREEQSVIYTQIIEPYHRIDGIDGKDLHSMFRDYLVSQHKEDLLPDDLKP